MADVKETPAQEGARLVGGARQGDYGTPKQNFDRIAALMSALLGVAAPGSVVGIEQGPGVPILSRPLTAAEAARLMRCVKLARQQFAPKRDNLADEAGYCDVEHLILEAERHG